MGGLIQSLMLMLMQWILKFRSIPEANVQGDFLTAPHPPNPLHLGCRKLKVQLLTLWVVL